MGKQQSSLSRRITLIIMVNISVRKMILADCERVRFEICM